MKAMYHMFFIMRRVFLVFVLVMSPVKYFQSVTMLVLSWMNLIYIKVHRPHLTALENVIDIFNETCIYLSCYMGLLMLMAANYLQVKDILGWLLIGVASLNIVFNVALLAKQNVMQLINWIYSGYH
jgi:hypothetical protein